MIWEVGGEIRRLPASIETPGTDLTMLVRCSETKTKISQVHTMILFQLCARAVVNNLIKSCVKSGSNFVNC